MADEVELVNDSGLEKSAGMVSESRLVILGVLRKSAGPGPARSVAKPGSVVAGVAAGWNTLRQAESELKLEGGCAQSVGGYELKTGVDRRWRWVEEV